jgi:hypothetical protein
MIFLIPVVNSDEPDDLGEKQDELREKALTASYDEYKELINAWRTLDTKAQGNITIAGIFVAAAFAYLTKFDRLGLGERVFLLFTVIFLIICVVLSLIVLQVREVPPHYLGGLMRKVAGDLEGASQEKLRAYLPKVYNMHANLWSSTSEKLIKANKDKGEFLWLAQVSLIVAIVTAAMLVILKIFSWG